MSGGNERLLNKLSTIALAAVLAGSVPPSSAQLDLTTTKSEEHSTLWVAPADIKSLDLYVGPGGKQEEPVSPLTFLKEDKGGTSPKFDVRDRDGVKWRGKLGYEAQPETVATRLLWAMGFFANHNYFMPEVKIEAMPTRLDRGQEFVSGNSVKALRLQRQSGGKKVGTWNWRHNPFKGSREFNGLRVMMALLSNWDLKDENNAIYEDGANSGHRVFEVSDVGASFGRSGKSYSDSITKHNLAAYQRSKFISKINSDYVDFAFPTHPPFLYVFNVPFFVAQMRNHWIGKHIPREDAKWIGSLLAQLSQEQIRAAFQAAGYSENEVDNYTAAVTARIAELKQL
jgi:hypothetical protein